MNTMNIALPSILRNYVLKRVEEEGYGSTSEYMRELIRTDQKRRAKDQLEQEILRGAASGGEREMTRKDWEALRARAAKSSKSR